MAQDVGESPVQPADIDLDALAAEVVAIRDAVRVR